MSGIFWCAWSITQMAWFLLVAFKRAVAETPHEAIHTICGTAMYMLVSFMISVFVLMPLIVVITK